MLPRPAPGDRAGEAKGELSQSILDYEPIKELAARLATEMTDRGWGRLFDDPITPDRPRMPDCSRRADGRIAASVDPSRLRDVDYRLERAQVSLAR